MADTTDEVRSAREAASDPKLFNIGYNDGFDGRPVSHSSDSYESGHELGRQHGGHEHGFYKPWGKS